ncbi:hypothetical protein OVS_02515 [Mycoplasma ovis str. Michigan]|uniref:DUF31 domain-containing protein n=1 Tax=Mycoplasma ovis str. Michigan TaxID=1415773 RepID=A0ABN4BM37_9MOLU|nr:trypsin-like peptidase domain-containing protein [Mycoplasma ovis]AHC40341.1 hypothetical protein OVS_02515 [Mycoplasma ovis str. Michigan]
MAIWKWGLVGVPAISGLAIGAQQFIQSSEELPPPEWDDLMEVDPSDRGDSDQEEDSSDNYSDSEQEVSQVESSLVSQETQGVKSEANPIFEKLDDYTFKLFASCNGGTGWILDYQLPKNGSYPLIWYIATNAHVVQKWLFDSSNPYKQILPTNRKGQWDKKSYYAGQVTKTSLGTADSCNLSNRYGLFDFNLSKQSDGLAKGSDKGAIFQNKIKPPRLFWVAVDFFKKDTSLDVSDNNFKDFAVVEIEFTNEQSAREITRNFADKYKLGSNNAIDVFAQPIKASEAKDNNENFYSIGYPSNKNDIFKYAKSWNERTLVADRLGEDNRSVSFVGSKKVEKIRGHANTQSFSSLRFNWKGKGYNRMGHYYVMKGTAMGRGSSGSMTIDSKGNLIGVRTISEIGRGAKHSWFIPLRSEELKYEGHFKTPKYDLILGTHNQKSSYKQQIEKYITSKKGVETWLSKRGNWTHKL